MSIRLDNLMLDACEKEIARLDKQVLELQTELLASVKKTALRCMVIHDDYGKDTVDQIDKEFQVLDAQQEMFKEPK